MGALRTASALSGVVAAAVGTLAVMMLASPSTATMLTAAPAANQSLYDFKNLVDIDGNMVDLAQYKGNVTLVINVASF